MFPALVSVVLLSACSAPSLLITPVSSKRELVETEQHRDSAWARDKIAIIEVTGLLSNTRRSALLSENENPVSLFVEQLEKARCDPRVKAIILRINSPGGTVVASEIMYSELKHFKKNGKPVVAILMDVAASGGFYVACACDEIIALPSTVTGSIGVIMQMVDVSGTLEMIGVRADAVTSGAYKDAGSPLRPMLPEERDVFQNIVNEMYGRFVAVVNEGRKKLDEPAVRSLADGRVYTAGQALNVGLIDRIGDMRAAIDRTKELAGCKRVRVVGYHRPQSYRPNYYAVAPAQPTLASALLDVPAWLDNAAPQFLYLWRPGK